MISIQVVDAYDICGTVIFFNDERKDEAEQEYNRLKEYYANDKQVDVEISY
jgi:hypothetical protein